VRILFCLLCLLSGVSGLIYETLWIRVLSLGVGSTSASLSLVLSIFFLGLALGSYVGGRWAGRFSRPWLAYGALEAVIGIYCALVIFPLFHFNKILGLLPMEGSFSWLGTALKAAIVFLLLILPTFCMGATLPLLVRAARSVFTQTGSAVSLLYGLNTLGAVFGALLTCFVLIPYLGILGANVASAALNLAVFAVVWVKQARLAPVELEAPRPAPQAGAWAQRLRQVSPLKAGILAVCALCGFGAIAAEVVWSKYLSIFFGTNIYGLGLVLSLYLLGIALGSLAISRWIGRVRDPIRWLAALLVAAMAMLVVSSHALNFAPVLTHVIGYYLGGKLSLLAIKCLVTFLVLLPPTCLFGMIFPLCVRILSENGKESEASLLGSAYSLNTIGSIAGSCLTGLVLVPTLGSSAALYAAVSALALVLAGFVAVAFKGRGERLAYAALLLVVVGATFKFGGVQFRNIISSAYFQSADPELPFTEVVRYFSRDYEEFKLIYEGRSGVISLSHDPQDGPTHKRFMRLKTNGLNESVYNLDDLETLPKYEALLGFLPFAFVRQPQSAFLIGYGGGFTTRFLTQTSLKHVHVAELEEGILKAAEVVHQGRNPVLDRPNLRLEIEDARYLLVSRPGAQYDMILSQPSHSWLSGVANLFTREFFEIVRARLTERGVFSQWLNLYNMDTAVLKSILRTFYEVFPHGAVFTQAGEQEMILIGSMSPLDLGVQKLALLAKNPSFSRQLAHVPISSAYDVLASFSLNREEILRLSHGARINTDVNAYAEVGQSRLFYRKDSDRGDPQAFLEAAYTGDFSGLVRKEDRETDEFYEGLLAALSGQGHYGKMLTLVARYEKRVEGSDDAERLARVGYWCLQVQRYASARQYLERSLELRRSASTLQQLLATYVGLKDYGSLERVSARYPGLRNDAIQCFEAHAALEQRGAAPASARFAVLVSGAARYRESCGPYFDRIVGRYSLLRGDALAAIPYLESYYKVYASDPETVGDLTAAYLALRDWGNARSFAPYVAQSLEAHAALRRRLADDFFKRGWPEDGRALKPADVATQQAQESQ
jgi:spermidine synthase